MKGIRVVLNICGVLGLALSFIIRFKVFINHSFFNVSPDALLEFSFSCFILAFCFQPKYTVQWRLLAFFMVLLTAGEGVLLL